VWRQDEDGDAVSMPRPSWPQAVPLARGSEPRGARGTRNGNYTDGRWAREAIEERKWLRSLVSEFAKKDPAR
jgi:hypothetical protein